MNNKLKKLPVGIYTLKEIIGNNYLYIDKTEIALNVINNNKYVFLSRPRRFGKSLFLDTLKNIFEGNKELFKGLYIYKRWNFEKKYPVIKISFANGKVSSRKELDIEIINILEENQKSLGLECKDTSNVSICFRDLIIKASERYNEKVVILIDEYDKPILDNINKLEQANEIREGLANFYSVIKGSDEYLKFAFLTGVSKFSKTSIFSGLNNITDITLNARYGNICGYTQKDIETSFLPYLQGVDLEKLKTWYNGYNFLKDKVYNPYNVLLFIQNDYKYKNYWFETGTPTFLIKLIKEKNYFLPQFSNLIVGEELLNSFDINNIKIESLFLQTGYLTIDEQIIDEDDFIEYKLKIPNKEVKKSLNNILIDHLTSNYRYQPIQKLILKSLRNADLDNLKEAFISIFASIPNNNYTKNNISHYEGYYASILYAYLMSLGLELIAEDITNKGRIDLTVKIEDKIYIIEFKIGNGNALQQIINKNYAQKYMNEGKKIYLVGINFDEEERNITGFECDKK